MRSHGIEHEKRTLRELALVNAITLLPGAESYIMYPACLRVE